MTSDINTDMDLCPSKYRLFDILENFWDYTITKPSKKIDGVEYTTINLIEHEMSDKEIQNVIVPNDSVNVFHHTEGQSKHIRNIEQLCELGYVLHNNISDLWQGKFFPYWLYDYKMALRYRDTHLNHQINFVPKLLCLNARPMWHRFFVVEWLYKKKWIDNKVALVSMLDRYNCRKQEIPEVRNGVTLTHAQFQLGIFKQKWKECKLPKDTFVEDLILNDKYLILDKGVDELHKNDRNHDGRLYSETSVSIVTETIADGMDGCFITEKTWKPFFNLHFPIFISQPGVVKFLKNFGLDLFDDLIDNSYDDYLDSGIRFVKALNASQELLEKISNFDKKQKIEYSDRLLKNQQMLLYKKIEGEFWV